MRACSEYAAVRRVDILAGHGKDGKPEAVDRLSLSPGDVVCLVGKTGAGKTQLLDDIVVLAQGDTPSGRSVLVNGALPSTAQRYDMSTSLVAYLSQGMQFVMDATVQSFLEMHAWSRQAGDPSAKAAETISCANNLAGEPFAADTPLASLSGGQSRALMVADVALISSAPIVLLDEIENAGIDKYRALSLLAMRQKIVLVSTHDPVIALMGTRRIVISGGAMARQLDKTPEEERALPKLREIDVLLAEARTRLREGERISDVVFKDAVG